jgi:hypothetical protein
VGAGARWTAEGDQRLLALKAAGKRVVVIAKQFPRTLTAVEGRLLVLKNRSKQLALGVRPKGRSFSRNK